MNPYKDFKEVVKSELEGLIEAGSLPAGPEDGPVFLDGGPRPALCPQAVYRA